MKIVFLAVALFISMRVVADDAPKTTLCFNIPSSTAQGMLRQEAKAFTVQIPIAYKKGQTGETPDISPLTLQVWLLKRDGTCVPQNERPFSFWMQQIADYSTCFARYTFAKVPSSEITGITVKMDGKLHSELLDLTGLLEAEGIKGGSPK